MVQPPCTLYMSAHQNKQFSFSFLYSTILMNTQFYCTFLYSTILNPTEYSMLLYISVQYKIQHYCTAEYSIIFSTFMYTTVHSYVQYPITLYKTAQYSTTVRAVLLKSSVHHCMYSAKQWHDCKVHDPTILRIGVHCTMYIDVHWTCTAQHSMTLYTSVKWVPPFPPSSTFKPVQDSRKTSEDILAPGPVWQNTTALVTKLYSWRCSADENISENKCLTLKLNIWNIVNLLLNKVAQFIIMLSLEKCF